MCTAEDVLTPEKQALLEQQVAVVMANFQALLSIERVQGPLRVASSASCGRDGGVSFPEAYLSQGACATPPQHPLLSREPVWQRGCCMNATILATIHTNASTGRLHCVSHGVVAVTCGQPSHKCPE